MIRLILLLLCLVAGTATSEARSFYVQGAGGVPLATTDIGPANAPGILFLHGIGHGRESFHDQFTSELAEKYHLVAFDLRGHGMSGKPSLAADYTDPSIWADDVKRVMDATGLTRPVVVAWSYGSLVAADLIRTHGSQQIAGLVLVGALGGLVQASPSTLETPANLLKARTLQVSPTLADQREASLLVAPYLTAKPTKSWWLETTTALNLMVPPYVQPLLRQHPSANTDLVDRLTMPVLIAHGAHDGAVSQASVDSLLKHLSNGQASRYADAGHAPFVEDATRFNRELMIFIEQLRSYP